MDHPPERTAGAQLPIIAPKITAVGGAAAGSGPAQRCQPGLSPSVIMGLQPKGRRLLRDESQRAFFTRVQVPARGARAGVDHAPGWAIFAGVSGRSRPPFLP